MLPHQENLIFGSGLRFPKINPFENFLVYNIITIGKENCASFVKLVKFLLQYFLIAIQLETKGCPYNLRMLPFIYVRRCMLY